MAWLIWLSRLSRPLFTGKSPVFITSLNGYVESTRISDQFFMFDANVGNPLLNLPFGDGSSHPFMLYGLSLGMGENYWLHDIRKWFLEWFRLFNPICSMYIQIHVRYGISTHDPRFPSSPALGRPWKASHLGLAHLSFLEVTVSLAVRPMCRGGAKTWKHGELHDKNLGKGVELEPMNILKMLN